MSVVGNIRGHDSNVRHRSPSVEIFIDDDSFGYRKHDDDGSNRAKYHKSAKKRSSQVSPFTTSGAKPGPDRYQRALNKKYAELKRLVLEAVSFSGKASLFNQNAKEQPRLRVSKNRRDDGELSSELPEYYEGLRRHRPRRSDNGRGLYAGQQEERGAMRNSWIVEQSNQDDKDTNHFNQLRRVTFDDSYRIDSAAESRKSTRRRIDVEMPSSDESARPRGRARVRTRQTFDDDVISIMADKPNRNHRRVVDSDEQDGSEDMDMLRSDVDEQDVVYYTRQMPRRKIKATTSRLEKRNEKQGVATSAGLERSQQSNPVKLSSKSTSVDESNPRRKARDTCDLGSTTEKSEESSRSRLRKRTTSRADRNNNAKESCRISPSTTNAATSASPSGRASLTTSAADYHLKFTENGKIRDWLRDKNRAERKRRRDERRLLKAKELEKRLQEEAKAERKKISDSVVGLWLDEKKKEEKTLKTKEIPQLASDDTSRVLRGSVEVQDARGRDRSSKSPIASRSGGTSKSGGTSEHSSQVRSGSSLLSSQNEAMFEKMFKQKRSVSSAEIGETANRSRASNVSAADQLHVVGGGFYDDPKPSKHSNDFSIRSSSSRRSESRLTRSNANKSSEKLSSRRPRPEPQGADAVDEYHIDRRPLMSSAQRNHDEFDDVISEDKLSLAALSLSGE